MVAEMKKKHILVYNPILVFSDTHMRFWYITQTIWWQNKTPQAVK